MRTRVVNTGEANLYVVEDGDVNKPGILFLHGFPDSHKVWENQFRALARDFHVISFDMRGCGNSSLPARRDAYRIEQLLPDIRAVIDATRGRDGQVHLVGHDWGSVLGWSFVAEPRYAARVLSWTSMSGPHVGLLWEWVGRKLASGSWSGIKAAAEQFAHSWYIFALNIPGAGRAVFRLAGVPAWKQAMRQGGVPAGDPCLDITQEEVERITFNTIGLYQQNAFSPPPVPAHNSIRVPTQLLVPVDDAFIRPQLFEYLDEVCTDLTRVTLEANHWAQRSNPEEVTGLIRGFITRVGRTAKPAAAAKKAPEKTAAVTVTAKAGATKAAAVKTPAGKTAAPKSTATKSSSATKAAAAKAAAPVAASAKAAPAKSAAARKPAAAKPVVKAETPVKTPRRPATRKKKS